MKKFFYSLLLLFPLAADCQLQISVEATPFVIDFTGFSGLGFQPTPGIGQLSSSEWSVTGMSDGDLYFDSTQVAAGTDFTRGTSGGGVTTGGIYAFNTGTGNIILGVQPGASDFTPGDFRLRIRNTTGNVLTKLFVSYNIYYLNNENRANALNFSSSSDNSSYTNHSALDFATPDTADSAALWIAVSRSMYITGLSIANDSMYYLRWRGIDAGGSGSRDEYGIDDIAIVGNPTNITADFSASNVCENDSANFSDLSTTVNGNIISWQWDFGDGTGTSTQQNPSYLYSASGTFNVQLVVTNDSSETDTVVKTVIVYPSPVASFSASDFCFGSTTLFSDNSNISSGAIVSYSWDFGDANSDSVQNPSHQYSSAGNYNVTLVVVSDYGCNDSQTNSIDIYSLPVIDTSVMILTSANCGANDGSITGISVSGNSPFTYLWNPSMQTTLDLTNVAGGNYTLSVDDGNNCSASLSIALTSAGMPPAPSANSPSPYCDGETISDLTATGTGGTLNWYDDSTLTNLVGTGSPFTPALSLGDNYFYVTETTSCEGPATTVVVTVNPVPTANAGADASVCDGDCAQLTASGGGNYQWFPTTCLSAPNIANPTACCSAPDTIVFSVVVTNSFGCSDTDDVQVIVNENPVAVFGYSQTMPDASVINFLDSSVGNVVSWLWDFGNGSGTSTQQNPTYDYAIPSPQYFLVFLTVTDNNGCADTFSDSVFVDAGGFVSETTFSQSINIYPNPNDGKFNVQMSQYANVQMKIYNVLGEKIYFSTSTSTSTFIDLSGFPEGVYFMTITDGEATATKRIVVVR